MDDFTSAERALLAIHDVLHAAEDDDLHRQTPCRDFDVIALADHLVDTIARLAAAAGIQTPTPTGIGLDQRIQQLTQPILSGWRHRGLADNVEFSGRILPAQLALGILSLELVVHGWDFAVALRRRLYISDVHAAHVLALARQTLTEQSRAVAGFDPPVPVPANASVLDQLIGFTGRDPRWSAQ
jgi:uncharacterized protein (TIGR03086 family)